MSTLREEIAKVVMDMPDQSTNDDQAHALWLADRIIEVVARHLMQQERSK